MKPAAAAVAIALVSFPVSALRAVAMPTGAQVQAGAATLQQPNARTLIVKQSTDRAVINWNSFSIASGESVVFQQPSSSSVALNPVIGSDPSLIFGSLQANGQLFLINPSGVIFGRGATVDVGGIVASTLGISAPDFMAGRYEFKSGAASGSVVNHGTIRAADGGYVALLGKQVNNSGTIVAQRGSVALGAGDSMLLDFNGDGLLNLKVNAAAAGARIDHGGLIQADGGRVLMTAQAKNALVGTVLNVDGIVMARGLTESNGTVYLDGGSSGATRVSGIVDASSTATEQRGGDIRVLGEYVGLFGNATLNASGAAGGGTVLVGGDFQGKNVEVPNSRVTYVGRNARIHADATQHGDGGKVIVWADDTTKFYGEASVRGGAQAGDGGFVEISGKSSLVFRGRVDATAPNGKTGTLLLDPDTMIVKGGMRPPPPDTPSSEEEGEGEGSLAPPLAAAIGPVGSINDVYEAEIEELSKFVAINVEARRVLVVDNVAFDYNSGNPGDGPGVLALAANKPLTLRTNNNGPDETGGIDLVTGGFHGANLRIVTSGPSGSLTVQSGFFGDQPSDIRLPHLTGGGLVSVTAIAGGNIDISSITLAPASAQGQSVDIRSLGPAAGVVTIPGLIDTRGSTADGARSGGSIFIEGHTIGLNAIDASGGAGTTGPAGSAGQILLSTNSGPLTLNGNILARGGNATTGNNNGAAGGSVRFSGPVVLGSNVTIDTRGGSASGSGTAGAGGAVTFSNTVNADSIATRRQLNINAAGSSVDFGVVGDTQPLGGLTVAANQLRLNGAIRLDGGGAVDFRNVAAIIFAPATTIDTDAAGGASNAGAVLFNPTGTANPTSPNGSLTIDASADGGGRAGAVELGTIGNLVPVAVLTVAGDLVAVNGNAAARQVFITADEVRTDPSNGIITATQPFVDFNENNAAVVFRGLTTEGTFGREAPPDTNAVRIDAPGLLVVIPNSNRDSSTVWLRGDPNRPPRYEFTDSATHRRVCYNDACAGQPPPPPEGQRPPTEGELTGRALIELIESPERRAALVGVLDELRRLLDEALMAGFAKENVRRQLVRGLVLETGPARPGIDEFTGDGVRGPQACTPARAGVESGAFRCEGGK
jgi:filamentous hemagglutinin family protein